MDGLKPRLTNREFRQLLAMPIEATNFKAAIDRALAGYEQARARRFDLKRQLAEHDAQRPEAYSAEWTQVRYAITQELVACLKLVEQSRDELAQARATLWQARRTVSK